MSKSEKKYGWGVPDLELPIPGGIMPDAKITVPKGTTVIKI